MLRQIEPKYSVDKGCRPARPHMDGRNITAIGVRLQNAGEGFEVAFWMLLPSISRGRLQERIRFFCRPSLLIVDEIGYLPVVQGGGNLFFQLVNARYELGAKRIAVLYKIEDEIRGL